MWQNCGKDHIRRQKGRLQQVEIITCNNKSFAAGVKVFFHFFFSIFISASFPVQNQVKKDTPWLPKNTVTKLKPTLKKKKNTIPAKPPPTSPTLSLQELIFLKPVYFQRGENPGGGARRSQALFIRGTQKGGSQKPHFREGVYSNFVFWQSHHCKICGLIPWDIPVSGK